MAIVKQKKIWSKKMSRDELEQRLALASSVVKLVCGIANNAAQLVMLEAHDQVKRHPRYKQRIKFLFKKAFDDVKRYERRLLHTQTNRFFHIGDMSAEIRKKYGDITDAQYFEYWQGLGGSAYSSSRLLVSSLANKFRLSLVNHKVGNPEIIAWGLTAQVALDLSCKIFESAINEVSKAYKLPLDVLYNIFGVFSMKDVSDRWHHAIMELDCTEYELDDIERRNISLGVSQLEDAWVAPSKVYSYASQCTEDFEDIFRTKGEWKKALRIIAEAKQEVL